jgi:hypothetical protein
MIRAINRTDVTLFLFSSPPERPNETVARDVPDRKHFFSTDIFLEHWVAWKGSRHSWVCDESGRIDSLISLRSSASSAVWYIDYLQAVDEEHCRALLENVSASALKKGVRKLYIDISANSPVVGVAKRAGFVGYNTYNVYRYKNKSTPRPVPPPQPYSIRIRESGDDAALYALFNKAVPPPVRNAEGATFDEWRNTSLCCALFDHRTEYLLSREGNLVGCLRVSSAGGAGCFEIMFDQMEGSGLEWLADYALSCLSGRVSIYSVVSSSQWQLRGMLENAGFEHVSKCEALLKETVIRVEEPQFMPARA